MCEDKELKCEDCGKSDASVTSESCPYEEEINGSIIPVDICPECYHERCMDI